MEVLVALGVVDELIFRAKRLPLGDQRRLDRAALLGAIEQLRSEVVRTLPMPAQSLALPLIDTLDEFARSARPVPVLSGVRVDRHAGLALVDAIRLGLLQDLRSQVLGRPPIPGGVQSAMAALEAIFDSGKPSFSGRRIRIDPAHLERAIAQLHSAVSESLPEPRRSKTLPLLDELQDVARSARALPLGVGARLNREQAYDVLDRIRAAVW